MPWGITGHDKESDKLYAAPEERTVANGGATDGTTQNTADEDGDYGAQYWGGVSPTKRNGFIQAGTTGADYDVARYRQLGAQQQGAVQLGQQSNHFLEDQSRNVQLGALDRLRAAAQGQAPSRAAALAQMQGEDALRQSSAGVAGAHGPGASVAAMRGAMGNLGSRTAAVNGSTMDARAAETARDQAAFAGGANATQGQDLSNALAQTQLQASQNATNEQRQQAYEKMAWDTRNAELQASMERQKQAQAGVLAHRQQRDAENAQNTQTIKDSASMGMAPLIGLLSDERAKTNISPIGGLSRLRRGL